MQRTGLCTRRWRLCGKDDDERGEGRRRDFSWWVGPPKDDVTPEKPSPIRFECFESEGEPSRWNNHQREALAYSTGFVDGLSGGLSAPSCVEIDSADDGTTWLWLEVVGDEAEGLWPISRYGLAAYHLGRFNGMHASTGSDPAYPWFSRNWLRGWIEEASPYIDVLSTHRNHAYVAQMYDADHVLRLWRDRQRRLDYLESLPQTLCHLDAYRGNLFTAVTPSAVNRQWLSTGPSLDLRHWVKSLRRLSPPASPWATLIRRV